jgi:protein-S-isoprenylcysteine O-methyltransferase Ste14
MFVCTFLQSGAYRLTCHTHSIPPLYSQPGLMVYLLRQLLSVVILPVTMVVFVPLWIARATGIRWEMPADAGEWAAVAAGLVLGGIGFALFAASLWHFATEGRGTLAPWDPPRHLVVRGPYRYVRNPMISGVIFMLVGVALSLRSKPHGIWAVIFTGANFLWIPIFEEPQLEARFGAAYSRYRRGVRRFLPRVRPWKAVD